ncbi:MAG: hypothetical protein AAFY26_27965, partial [Cyanobacteria bacterium J06638_22]
MTHTLSTERKRIHFPTQNVPSKIFYVLRATKEFTLSSWSDLRSNELGFESRHQIAPMPSDVLI